MNKTNLGNVYAVGIDGSNGGQNAWELVMKDFYKPGLDQVILIHIHTPSKEHSLSQQFRSKAVFQKYTDLMSDYNKNDYELVFEERRENTENVFVQINEIAAKKQANLLVLGFRGTSEVEESTKIKGHLGESIVYLIHKPAIPVLVIKNKVSRKFNKNEAFKWLVCLESPESRSFKAIETVFRYVDIENDVIHALHVAASAEKKDSQISKATRKAFEEEMKRFEVKRFDFSVVAVGEGGKDVHQCVDNYINAHFKEESHWVDFVVMGYNSTKYMLDKSISNTTVDVLKYTNTNVFFDH